MPCCRVAFSWLPHGGGGKGRRGHWLETSVRFRWPFSYLNLVEAKKKWLIRNGFKPALTDACYTLINIHQTLQKCYKTYRRFKTTCNCFWISHLKFENVVKNYVPFKSLHMLLVYYFSVLSTRYLISQFHFNLKRYHSTNSNVNGINVVTECWATKKVLRPINKRTNETNKKHINRGEYKYLLYIHKSVMWYSFY